MDGTIFLGVQGFGLRQSRYWGSVKTHSKHLATVAAFNLDRLGAWFEERPLAKTRVSRFARLAPTAAYTNTKVKPAESTEAFMWILPWLWFRFANRI